MPAILKEVNRSMCHVAFSLSYRSSILDQSFLMIQIQF